MQYFHSIRLRAGLALLGALAASAPLPAQAPAPTGATLPYMVFLRSRPIGQETVTISRQSDGWKLRGTNRLGPPLDVTTRVAEIDYDPAWRPTRMLLDGIVRGQEMSIKTAFAEGQASSEISIAGTTNSKVDAVAADTVVLPNAFLGSYAALARQLVGETSGKTFHAYIAPQGEVPMRVDGVFEERIETPCTTIEARRFALVVTNPPPAGDLHLNVWIDAGGALLRFSVPAQMLEVAREDIASAAARTTAFSVPGDETVRIPAAGFGLAGSLAKPANATGRLPALILVGGSGPTDRDGLVAGIPILGQLAAHLVEAGFLVVRYDKRGVGQSGGRIETATLNDYADDVRAVFKWLESRRDVDKRRIGVVGHSEGAWVAMQVARREKRVAALALLAGSSVTGGELILEQQGHLLARIQAPNADRQAKVALQKRINDAALTGAGWDGIPDELRRAADTPWFQSFLAFDPARVMRDVRQPVLIVQGALDTQVPPHHADRLADYARERRRRVAVEVVHVPGVNHLFVPAKTGEVDEYAVLPEKQVSPATSSAIALWMAKILG
ncbi:MAG: alpha/beta hydrolase family protein [Acidobacteriota bacterium]